MSEIEAVRTANESRLRRFTAFVGIFAMLLILAIALILVNINASKPGVTEFSEEPFNASLETDSVNETSTTPQVPPQQVKSSSELNASNAFVTDSVPSWNADPNPFLAAIRDFLFQARDGLLEVSSTVSEPSVHQDTEEMFKVFEQGLIEATTMLMKVTDDADLFTTPAAKNEEKEEENIRVVKIEEDLIQERGVGMGVLGISNKKQAAMNLMANATTGCSNCYEKLNTCVQKCFSDNNCHDVQRQVRSCPPAPTRLCNPFAQWSPVDECQNHEDCISPNLCCNDGCVNKCSPGVWRLP
ncbi:LOW QUALITY PROTEIN: uncharacterized protein LOC129231706 [Uloborus diversus]|uniref:LOW QUALITY PROTEIN: uncharacterized protein LOC129231706 n=1 Tax=Uloborus diversus TaxID=327109 RepID=UPI00240A205D|nr:LOW QUALITY PROTEIN: uncharacterized protein LOC129231706 [Uloborus diversus]